MRKSLILFLEAIMMIRARILLLIVSRRQFIKAASAVAGRRRRAGTQSADRRSAHIGGDDEIKIGLIGCGGRGRGAATQALETKGKVTLWAACDAFAENMQNSLQRH